LAQYYSFIFNFFSGKLKNQSNADNTFSSKSENRGENDHTYQNQNQTINCRKSNNIDEFYDNGSGNTNTPDSNTNSEFGALQTHPDFLEFSEENFFTVFQYCSIPWALARVDGRFCECNESFIRASGFSRTELLSSTIFNLINTSDLQDTFRYGIFYIVKLTLVYHITDPCTLSLPCHLR
jgi:hypothetical protein